MLIPKLKTRQQACCVSHSLLMAEQNEVLLRPRRCLPQASSALQAQLIDSVTAEAAAHATAGASALSAYFNNPGQRLQRYIGDIRKGFSIIIAAGTRALLAPAQGHAEPACALSPGACAGL